MFGPVTWGKPETVLVLALPVPDTGNTDRVLLVLVLNWAQQADGSHGTY